MAGASGLSDLAKDPSKGNKHSAEFLKRKVKTSDIENDVPRYPDIIVLLNR